MSDAGTTGGAGDWLALAVRGETLRLHADRALSWPARRTLVVADIHFGKDDVFRRAGLAIPAGAVQEDLGRLSALLASTASERLLVLGDFVHGAVAQDDEFPRRFAPWRARHRELAIEVVAGNHDRHLRGAPQDWAASLRWHAEALHEPPFAFVHDPAGLEDATRAATPHDAPIPGIAARPDDAFVVSGHVHPVTFLPVPGGRRLRVPVFWRRTDALVLPAFGRLTGGHAVRAAAGEQLIVAGPRRVHALRADRDAAR